MLEKQGLTVSYPRERMSSEALLALPELKNITGKKALIVRGAGGREIIAEGLRAKSRSCRLYRLSMWLDCLRN